MALEAEVKGDHKTALDYIEQVLIANPNHARAWHVKGDCLDSMGLYEAALKSYNNALKLDPDNAETWFNMGLTLKKMGHDDVAEYCMDKGVKFALGY